MQELTKAQENYFKDSIIRNSDGSLKTCYHGSKVQHNEFSKDYIGYGALFGKGFYFTDNFDIAASYGENGILSQRMAPENVFKVYLNIKNVFDLDQPLTDELIKSTVKTFNDCELYIDDIVYDYNDWPYECREDVANMVCNFINDPSISNLDYVAEATQLIINLNEIDNNFIATKLSDIRSEANSTYNDFYSNKIDKKEHQKNVRKLKRDLKALLPKLQEYPKTLNSINEYLADKEPIDEDIVEVCQVEFYYECLELKKSQLTSLQEVKENLTYKDLLYLVTDGFHNHPAFDTIMASVAQGCDGYQYEDVGSGGYINELDEVKHTCYVVFEPNQIKSIDNLYPTTDNNFKDNSKEYFKHQVFEDLEDIDSLPALDDFLASAELRAANQKDNKNIQKDNLER